MTLTAFVGALLALLPRPEKPVPIPVESEVERLTKENDRLERSHARLVDHIERLERELLLEQHLCTHWREAAQRIAKQSREEREARELRLSQEALALYQHQTQQNAQAQAQLGMQQCAMQNAQAALGMQNVFGGFCNCVPSRSQVWEEERRR